MTKTITIEGGVYLNTATLNWNAEPNYMFLPGDLKLFNEYQPVAPYTITVEAPAGYDHRTEAVKALEAQRQEIRAKFEATMTEIASQIAKLTAIGYEA